MRKLLLVALCVLIPAVTHAGQIVVVIYHYTGQIIRIAQCFQREKFSTVLRYCPPGGDQNYEYFSIPDSLKVGTRGWTVSVSAAQVKYQPGIADSINVTAYQNGTQAYRDSIDATLR